MKKFSRNRNDAVITTSVSKTPKSARESAPKSNEKDGTTLLNKTDFDYWGTRETFEESEVIHLWFGTHPQPGPIRTDRGRWLEEKLLHARIDGFLRSKVTHPDDSQTGEYRVTYQRNHLIDFAERLGQKPAFLFPEEQDKALADAQKNLVNSTATTAPNELTAESHEPKRAVFDENSTQPLSVKEFARIYGRTEGSLRNRILYAKNPKKLEQTTRYGKPAPEITLKGNGLENAISRVGGLVKIIPKAFFEWERSNPSIRPRLHNRSSREKAGA